MSYTSLLIEYRYNLGRRRHDYKLIAKTSTLNKHCNYVVYLLVSSLLAYFKFAKFIIVV